MSFSFLFLSRLLEIWLYSHISVFPGPDVLRITLPLSFLKFSAKRTCASHNNPYSTSLRACVTAAQSRSGDEGEDMYFGT